MTSHTLKKNFDKLKEKKETALITYTVAGDPDKETSLEILKSIAKSGANIIEIGLAHNTPIGDGKEIQNSAHRAISNGILVKDLFDIIEDFKKNLVEKFPLDIFLDQFARRQTKNNWFG